MHAGMRTNAVTFIGNLTFGGACSLCSWVADHLDGMLNVLGQTDVMREARSACAGHLCQATARTSS